MFSGKNLFKITRFKSIGWKLTLWYAFLFLISIIFISFYLYQRLEHQLYREADFFLYEEIREFNEFVANHADDLSSIEHQMLEESAAIRKHYQMYYSILNEQGEIILQTSEIQPFIRNMRTVASLYLPNSNVKEYKVVEGKDVYTIRLATQPLQGQNGSIYYVQTGVNLERIETTLSNYRKNILLILPIFFILSSVGGFFLVRRSLKPISQITRMASRITASNLGERLPIRGTNDELDKLAQTFNKMIERLDQAYRKLSQFSIDAAHELRTPITSLIGEIEITLSRQYSVEEYRNILTSNLEELTRLVVLVNNLLFLSKDERTEQAKDTIELNGIARDITELFRPVAEENGLNLSSDILSVSLYVMGDKWRIEQLISNLLDNAIRYNHPGGSVTVLLRQNEDYAELIVEDTGVGISEDEQTKIFDRFYRVDPSRSRNTGGFGLGLNIVKSIVESYSGAISVTSQLGKGSTFTVKLPLQKTFSVIRP